MPSLCPSITGKVAETSRNNTEGMTSVSAVVALTLNCFHWLTFAHWNGLWTSIRVYKLFWVHMKLDKCVDCGTVCVFAALQWSEIGSPGRCSVSVSPVWEVYTPALFTAHKLNYCIFFLLTQRTKLQCSPMSFTIPSPDGDKTVFEKLLQLLCAVCWGVYGFIKEKTYIHSLKFYVLK